MKKNRVQISVLVFLLLSFCARAQNNYRISLKGVDKDSAVIVEKTGISTGFISRTACEGYISRLPGLLQSKGYVTASIDTLQYGSSSARLVLFLGEAYKWINLDAGEVDKALLQAAGWQDKSFSGKPLDFTRLQQLQEKMLVHLENTGYPFARLWLDSLQLENENVSARLKVNKGPLYKIDSIRMYGNGKIANIFLQRYLDIPNGSVYSKEKLLSIDKKLNELPYVEMEKATDISLLGPGSVLNVYLKQKKSSQVNALIGFLPNNDQLSSKKLLVTGEANILLRNAFGNGETIGFNWQQLQKSSPRLHLLYQQPYLFTSPLGLDFAFDIYKKDSSFVNINLQLGAQYSLNTNQNAKIFIQRFQAILSTGGINAPLVIQTRRLPDAGDVSWFNAGLDYELNNTDYRFNPRRGNELRFIVSGGTRKIKKNNEVVQLKDPNDPGFNFERLYDTVSLKTTYQARLRATAAHYFPLGKGQRNTIKTALNGGFFQSKNTFRNELFQIGGFKLLRGFDEETQFLSQFVLGTLEYHYIVGRNSYFYVLADGGWGKGINLGKKTGYTYISAGLGLAFERKAGIFNLAWAVGKRNDLPFDFKKSKIHVGFANYF
jgi:outer membrane protein assembly factor BamA